MTTRQNYDLTKNTTYYINGDFNIGKFIYDYRVFKNITQEDLAKMSDLKQPQISRIEKNKNVKMSTVYKVLKSLGLHIETDGLSFSFNSDDNQLQLGSLIAFKRKMTQLTQQKLAEKTSLKQPQIVQIEKNNDITVFTLKKILKILDLQLKITVVTLKINAS